MQKLNFEIYIYCIKKVSLQYSYILTSKTESFWKIEKVVKRVKALLNF